jgi:hypothetical protein
VIKFGGSFILIFLLSLGDCFSQNAKPNYPLKKGEFFFDFGLELQGRDFAEGTFLGDTYQVSLGYRMTMNMGLAGYPGLGWYVGRNNARVFEDRFLGGYFSDAILGDGGVFIFHSIPLGRKFVIRPELGFGNFRVIHGVSPSRFILNYSHFFGRLGFQYPIVEISENFSLSLSLGASYSLYNGRGIVINPEDQSYIQRSNGFQVATGLFLKIH